MRRPAKTKPSGLSASNAGGPVGFGEQRGICCDSAAPLASSRKRAARRGNRAARRRSHAECRSLPAVFAAPKAAACRVGLVLLHSAVHVQAGHEGLLGLESAGGACSSWHARRLAIGSLAHSDRLATYPPAACLPLVCGAIFGFTSLGQVAARSHSLARRVASQQFYATPCLRTGRVDGLGARAGVEAEPGQGTLAQAPDPDGQGTTLAPGSRPHVGRQHSAEPRGRSARAACVALRLRRGPRQPQRSEHQRERMRLRHRRRVTRIDDQIIQNETRARGDAAKLHPRD